MTTTYFNGCTLIARPELGAVTLAERRGDMAVVRTERGVTLICSCREPHPHQGAVAMPCDVEPEGAA